MVTVDVDRNELSLWRLAPVVVTSPTFDAAVNTYPTGCMSDAYGCEHSGRSRSASLPVPAMQGIRGEHAAHTGPSHRNGGKTDRRGSLLHPNDV